MSDERDPRTYAIIGASYDVHREQRGSEVKEVYAESLAVEFELRGVPFQRLPEVSITYKGRALKTTYRPDFVCFGEVVVEVVVADRISEQDEARIINFLKCGGFSVGLVVNFGGASVQHRRFVNSAGN